MLDNAVLNQKFYPEGKNVLANVPRKVIIKLQPYSEYSLNDDSYRTLQFLKGGASLRELANRLEITSDEEITNLLKFLQGAVRTGILTTDESKKGVLKDKSPKTNPPLERVFLEVTDRCNLKCAHCYMSASSMASSERILTKEEIYDIIQKADELGVYRLDFTGGELLFRPDIKEILQRASDRLFITNIFTNGTMIDKEMCAFLVNLGNIRVVFISLDDIIEDQHDDFRGVKGAFRKTVEGIKLLREAGQRVVVNITITKRNYDRVDQIIRFCQEDLKVQCRIAPIVYVGRGTCLKEDDLTLQEIASAMKNVLGEGNTLTSGYCDDGNNLGEKNIPGCGVGDKMLYIRSNGEICLCPTLSSREDVSFELGQISKDDLCQVWEESRVLRHFRTTYCKYQNCEYLSICRGGCRSRAFLQNGDLFSPDVVVCTYFDVNKNE